ncbi:hypothetical protein PBRA_009150 [Plasmodiophora brassicae]|uniref:Protein kinase domain-containing protein n=1 Tax=Plasmodiophora brassicae TaxID=37360 RepID=A0A0G4J5I5_PLABS|nr:hypothetical protein PBRA_009150 [Plasmodiophora brassicae]
MSSDSVYAREATLSSDDESEDTSSSIINRPTSRAGSLASGRGSRSRSRKKRVGQYIIGETIGKGSFGTVKVGTHCDTGERVALKFLSKKQVRDISEVERLFRESAILTSLKCEHIIRLYEVIDDVAHIVMVMELAQGGELLDVIKARHALPEREACKVFSEIVAGVEYCHRKNVIHRDLKLENILMVNQTVKIADFGLSNTAILGRSELGTACGTPSYLAPEQINREAGQHIGAPADLWSMGVILYAMVAGFLPFQARSTPALFKKILNLEFTYPDYFSEELRDLIGRMLTPDPESRATISEVKSHPWYMMELSDLADASTRQVSEDAVKQAREKVSEKAAQAKVSSSLRIGRRRFVAPTGGAFERSGIDENEGGACGQQAKVEAGGFGQVAPAAERGDDNDVAVHFEAGYGTVANV